MSEQAYETHNDDGAAGLLFLCDHASNRVPADLHGLGLPEKEFARHIAYDIGARALTLELAARFNAPAITACWSRLVVDLNRGADDPTVVMRLSDGEIVPGNRTLDDAGIAERIRLYHAPYHDAVARRIAGARVQGEAPVLISMHSFTPVLRNQRRPWHIGILWDKDGRLALPLMEELARPGDIVVGDNEPYSGELENDTLYRHGTMNGLPHVLIEIRQDLLADDDGVRAMADRVEQALRSALEKMGKPDIRYTRPLASGDTVMDEKLRTECEAAAFRRLVAHLQKRTDVQNIDLMTLAGFCRNCLGDWYREAAAENGVVLEKDAARALIYGMPPAEWKKLYQKEASPEAKAAFEKSHKTHS